MPTTHVRQFTLIHSAKCHSTISWIMSSYFPMNWFQGNRNIDTTVPLPYGVISIEKTSLPENKTVHSENVYSGEAARRTASYAFQRNAQLAIIPVARNYFCKTHTLFTSATRWAEFNKIIINIHCYIY